MDAARLLTWRELPGRNLAKKNEKAHGGRKDMSIKKAIIADDEPKIIQLIQLLGNWEKYGIEIVDECHDGLTALESIRKNKPDLVLSDIKMPDLDGLDLIRLTREEQIESHFILISGYRHFEYARSAVALNVIDYLLKPIDGEQLNKTLEKACREIEQSRENKENREKLNLIRARQDKEKMAHFWKDFIFFKDTARRERMLRNLRSIELCNAEYHTEFSEGCFMAVFMCSNIASLLTRHYSLLEDEMERRIDKYFGEYTLYYYYVNYLGCIVVLNFAKEHKKKIRESISALYYSVRDLSEVYGELFLNFGVSTVKEHIRDLKEAYFEAQSAEWGRLITMQNGVLDYSQIAGLKRVSDTEILSSKELLEIMNCIRYLRREELGFAFKKLSERSGLYGSCYPGSMAEVFFRIADAVRDYTAEENQQLIEKLNYCYLESRTFSQLIKNIYKVLDEFVEGEQKKSKEKLGKPIQEAVYYIRKHYAQPISQSDAAGAGNISVTYLSRLFKEELGIGFNEYLTKVRLEESEKLLSDTTLSIKEIAAAVGYPDEKYYSKLYKKVKGIKPSEYRKIYG